MPVENSDTLRDIATISANNDPMIGGKIAEAFDSAGWNGTVAAEAFPGDGISVRYIEGAELKSGYISEGFLAGEDTNECVFKNCKILIYDGSMTHINDNLDLFNELSTKNIPILIDGCQGAPHLKLDMQDIDCDFYAISCHKMYGPTGLGVLYAKKKWLDTLPPYQGGGGMIREVKKEGISFGDLPNKYEAGTMATAQVIAFNESIKFLEKIGMDNIVSHEKKLIDYGQEILKKNNSVRLVGNPKHKGSVISFTIDGIHPHDIATILDEDGVAIRAGHHCCQILHEKLGLVATARASLGVYNTKDDLDQLNSSIKKCKKIFNLK